MGKKKNIIGTLQESSLHKSLKYYYAGPQDKMESLVDGYVIDVVKEDELVEIQTNNFSAIKSKLKKLVKSHKLRVVYPVAKRKWLVKEYRHGDIERRKSPKKGNVFDIYYELIRIPTLLKNPNFAIDVVLIHEEEYRKNDGKGSWRRRGWSITDHLLIEVIKIYQINTPMDLLKLLPENLPVEFTNADLKELLPISKNISQKMTYTLRKMDAIELIGKKGRYNLHKICETNIN